MAVAEARAAWQRTANRCLVQEDAKRAPKLACCPSASPLVKQVNAGPASAADGQDATCLGFLPYKQDPSYLNLSPNTRWWLLQHQPNYGYQRTFANEQLNSPEAEMESIGSNGSSFTKVSGIHLEEDYESLYIDETSNMESLPCSHFRTSANAINKDVGAKKHEHGVPYDKNIQSFNKVEDLREHNEVTKKDSVGYEDSKKLNEVSFDSECNLFGDERSEPWWRTADGGELAHLVAQRSLALVENCDLPQPQKAHVKRDLYDDFCCCHHDEIVASSLDPKHSVVGFSRFSKYESCKLTWGSSLSKKWGTAEGGFQPGQDIPPIRADEAIPEARIHENDPSKAQLLEALRHSQTRAREAELAATQAYADKEHIIKLVFKQASQLFAYKQWFHLLQLENLYFQIRSSKNQQITTVFPVMLPNVPLTTRKLRKNSQRAPRGKQPEKCRNKHDISKYVVIFAVGLSLVGAGLLLGWTVGWMLPKF